jgi:integrating conjugative element protein (TIGR03749 family)
MVAAVVLVVVFPRGDDDLFRHLPALHQPTADLGVLHPEHAFFEQGDRYPRVGGDGLVEQIELGLEQVAKDGEAELEPVRIVEGDSAPTRYGDQADGADDAPARAQDQAGARAARRETPVPVVLTRFAAQNLYAPLRTVEALPGVMRVNLRRDLDLGTLMPTLPARAVALASWRLEDQWVTAVRLTNSSSDWISLDPRVLQGDFLTATFQHEALGPRGTPEDTTVLYLVTRGHGLAQSLLPAIHRFDPAVHLPQPKAAASDDREARHAQ